MCKRLLPVLLLLCLLLSNVSLPASAEEAIPDALLHQALLSDRFYRKDVEFWTEGHQILGTSRDGNRVEVYLSASVGGYGFMGGGFVMKSGWGGPCTVVLRELDGQWSLIQRKDIEDYNEMPSIMPQTAIDAFFADTDGDAVQRHILAQVQAYLDSIERTEPIMDYADLNAPLSGMLVCAANLSMSVGGDYPLPVTTMECLEDGQRYLYTRAWEPGEPGVTNPQYATAEYGVMTMPGATGTETLTKTRKADGAVLETTTIRVEEYRLTITLQDAGGSACYAFDFDGPAFTYRQPTVTREGQCGISTASLDAYASELPGQRQSVIETEAQVDFGDDERFTLLRDGSLHILVYSRLENGVWTEKWRNEKLLPATSMALYMNAYECDEPTLNEYGRFSCLRGDTLGIYAGEEHPELAVSLSRNGGGGWQVDTYSSTMTALHAYLFDGHILVNAADLSALQTAGIWFGSIGLDAAAFDPQALWIAKDELYAACAGAPNIEFFAGAEPLYMALGLEERLPVYAFPNAASPRGAKGKAAVSFEDWVIALCRQDQWMLVLYETSADHYRTGWVDTSGSRALETVCQLTMPAQFLEGRTAVTNGNAPLWDDPVNASGQLVTLKAGTQVTVLWEYGQLSYVEASTQNSVWRGFVEASRLR